MTQQDHIATQEIPVIADRVAHALITDLLTEAHTYLDDLIDAEIGKDPDAERLDAYTHAHVYGLVHAQIGRAATEYIRTTSPAV